MSEYMYNDCKVNDGCFVGISTDNYNKGSLKGK